MESLITRDSANRGTVNLIRRSLKVICTIAAAMALAAPAFAQNYAITDLGVVSTTPAAGATGDTDSHATAVNASGTVVGYSGVYDPVSRGSFADHAFQWTPSSKNGTTGTLSYLGNLPGAYCFSPAKTVGGITTPAGFALFPTTANDINSSGTVVGSSYTSADGTCATLSIHGVLYQNGIVQDLGVPPWVTPSGFYQIQPTSINDAGQIVGTVNYTDPWLYSFGGFHDLGSLPGISATTGKINSSGKMVGTVLVSNGSAGFVHFGIGPILATDEIGTLGGPNSVANGINDAGLIVGAASIGPNPLPVHAYLLDQVGQMHDLGTVGKSLDISGAPLSSSQGNAINNKANNVVGSSDVDVPQAWASLTHAVMWQNGKNMIDLNSLLPPLVQPPFGTSNEFGPTVPCPHITCWELLTATGINDLGQIVGEGLLVNLDQTTGQRHAFLLTPPCITAGGDSDGDGLCDDWEKNGYTTTDGVFVDLPSMGADPMHKDIFVQADYMVGALFCPPVGLCSYHTHKPNPDAMAQLTAAFANAPVDNPDRSTGITLHVDCGPDCIMNPLTGATWDSLSHSHTIAETDANAILGDQADPSCVPTTPFSCAYDFTAFDQIMMNNFLPSRSPIFHYMVFAHSIGVYQAGGLAGLSGLSVLKDSSFIVSLGNFAGQVGTSQNQAGAFMHELGHNLGLDHGGYDGINYKPNYLSVMNYSFQSDGLIKGGSAGLLDYSKFPSIPDLNENALNETVGLNGGAVLTNYGTAYFCPGSGTLGGGRRNVVNANGPIDWSCDGSDGLIETNVQADINQENLVLRVLSSSEDWNHLIYTGGSIGAAGVGSFTHSNATPVGETAVPIDSQTPFRVTVTGPGGTQVIPGASFNETFTIANTGLQSDTYNLSAVSASNWWNTTGIPSTLTLAGGASQQVTVPVSVSGCIAPGTQAQFKLKSVSQSHPSIADSVVAELSIASIPGFIGVPNVVGLSQAAAQAAIVNAGLVAGTVTTQSSTTVPAGTVISQSPIPCGTVAAGTLVSLTVSSGPPPVAVPNIVGGTQNAAYIAMNAAGLTVGTITAVPSSTIPQGNVISQNPTAGTLVAPGSTVSFVVSSGPPPVAMPNLVGGPEQAAIAAIIGAGLTVGTITSQMSSTVPEFIVTAQLPAAGSLVSPGTTVSFVFSSGSQKLVQVPDASGGFSGVTAAGLTVGTITPMLSSTVGKENLISQDPLAGTFVAVGTPVNVVYSAGPQLIPVANVVGQWQWTAMQGLFNNLDPFDQSLVPFGVTITRQPSTTVPDGYVISQNPAAGTPALLGASVNLVVSSGGPVLAVVPNTVTDATQYGNDFGIGTEANAINAINAAGFVLGLVTTQPSPTVPLGYVISQNPPGGTLAPWDTSVSLVVSAGGAPSVMIPNVVGMTQAAAVTAINRAAPPPGPNFLVDYLTYSFTTQSSATVPAGNIISQNPPAGPATLQLNLAYDSFFGNIAFAPVNLIISAGPLAVPSYSYVGQFGGGGIAVNGGVLNSSRGKGEITPYGIAIDPVSRNILVGDGGDGMVRIFDANGNFKSYFSGRGLCQCAFDQSFLGFFPGDHTGDGLLVGRPVAIAVDPVKHNIVVIDDIGDRVLIFNSAGQFQSVFGSRGSGPGQFVFSPFFYPHVAVDPATENIIVTDSGNNRVQIFNSAGVYLSQFGTLGVDGNAGQLFNPSGVAIDPVSHNIVVADWGEGRVKVFNSAGVYLSQFGTYGQGDGQFQEPNSVAIDPVSHNIVVAELGVGNENTNVPINRIQVFDSTGHFLSKFGGPGTGNGQLVAGGELAVDPVTRNILVGDFYRIDIFALPSSAKATTTAVVASINPANVGQSVTFTATVTGNSPTGTIQFSDGSATVGAPVVLTGGVATLTLSTLSADAHPITAVYTGDSSNATSTSAVVNEVVLPDTTPPVVTPPASISIPATQAGGAMGSAWPALAAFLVGGSAVDNVDPSPKRLAPQVGGVSVGNATLFAVGTTAVTFRFQDASGNIGSATATVTVTTGTPRITGSVATVGTDPSGAIYVNVVLMNTGTGNARNLKINSLVFRTLSGSGTVTYNSTLSPAVPITIGNLDLGIPVTIKMFLNVPNTATRVSVTESGPVQDILGTNYNFSTAEAFVP
jgi:beta-lactam-binding protein with PASTA domain